jgi:hypothetical protein
VSLCLPQIRHDLTRARTQAAAMGSQRLTAWATARASNLVWQVNPPLWSSGQSFWLQIHRPRVRFPTSDPSW